jgi:tetratricopeptide (TPR) repeat protein
MTTARFGACLIAAALAMSAAHAAISVIGNGASHGCYVEAEFGSDPAHGIALCTRSLSEEALSRHDRSSTFVNRGILRARAGNADGALADYTAALSVGGNDGEAYLNRSVTLIALHRYADARKDADEAIAHQALHLEVAYYNRAVANENLGDVQAAYADYKMAQSIAPTFAEAAAALSRFRVKSS